MHIVYYMVKVVCCFFISCLEQYRADKRPQNLQRNPQPTNTEWSYLKIPYISERLNHRITNIFRKENIPVRIGHKSYTLRQALSHTSTERKCTRDKCPISSVRVKGGMSLRNGMWHGLLNDIIMWHVIYAE